MGNPFRSRVGAFDGNHVETGLVASESGSFREEAERSRSDPPLLGASQIKNGVIPGTRTVFDFDENDKGEFDGDNIDFGASGFVISPDDFIAFSAQMGDRPGLAVVFPATGKPEKLQFIFSFRRAAFPFSFLR